jgi:hypothetical protein
MGPRLPIFSIFLYAILCAGAMPAAAADAPADPKAKAEAEESFVPGPRIDAPLKGLPDVKKLMPQVDTKHVNVRPDGEPAPKEPNLPKVKFLEMPPLKTLGDRVDALLYGIHTDIPPEYDYYGYEMRRYMANVGGPDVLGSAANLKTELENIRNAGIILEYWRKAVNKDIADLDKIITDDNADVSTNVRTVFRYNRAVADAFFVECQQWIDNNKALLEFLQSMEGAYQYEDPIFMFHDNADRLKFVSLYKARQEALDHIREHGPFAVMVY